MDFSHDYIMVMLEMGIFMLILILGAMSDQNWNTNVTNGIREIFQLTKKLKGTISGEHGIGFVQKDYIDIVLSQKNIEIQKGIKKLFDPNEILNPGKIFNA